MSEWLTAKEAATYAKCGVQSIYNGVKRKKLRAARMNGSRELRFLHEWIDQWLLAETTFEILEPDAPAGRLQ
jgi:excisionase family DNA binding protein